MPAAGSQKTPPENAEANPYSAKGMPAGGAWPGAALSFYAAAGCYRLPSLRFAQWSCCHSVRIQNVQNGSVTPGARRLAHAALPRLGGAQYWVELIAVRCGGAVASRRPSRCSKLARAVCTI